MFSFTWNLNGSAGNRGRISSDNDDAAGSAYSTRQIQGCLLFDIKRLAGCAAGNGLGAERGGLSYTKLFIGADNKDL